MHLNIFFLTNVHFTVVLRVIFENHKYFFKRIKFYFVPIIEPCGTPTNVIKIVGKVEENFPLMVTNLLLLLRVKY